MGIGDDHYPLPWQSLKYDTNLGGYSTGVSENQLKGAPKIATTIPGTGLTRPGPGQSMTIMELRSENIGPGKPGLSFQLTALLRTGRLGSRSKKPRCWAALSMFRGTALARLRWVRFTLRLFLDLGIASDFAVGRVAIRLPIRRGLLRLRHSGLPSVFAALVLLSLQVIFFRHGQLLNSANGLLNSPNGLFLAAHDLELLRILGPGPGRSAGSASYSPGFSDFAVSRCFSNVSIWPEAYSPAASFIFDAFLYSATSF